MSLTTIVQLLRKTGLEFYDLFHVIHSHSLTDTHSPSKFTLYAFIHRRQNIGSCKISPSCPCAGLNQQPRGPVSIQAKLPGEDEGQEE